MRTNSPSFALHLILNKKTRQEKKCRTDWTGQAGFQYTLCYRSAPSHPPSLTHAAAAHFLGHLFLRLFQLFEEFASQIGRIPTAPSRAPRPAFSLWSLNEVFCVYTGLLLLLPLLLRQGSAAVQEHDSQECSPLHFDLLNQRNPDAVSVYLSTRRVPFHTIALLS